jgi:hypothetical protein
MMAHGGLPDPRFAIPARSSHEKRYTSLHMKNRTSIALLLLLVAFVGAYILVHMNSNSEEAPCTMDVRQCPDGSYASRVPPACEFTACPGGEEWRTFFIDPDSGASFRYPDTLGTTYVAPVDWPPRVDIAHGPFTCIEAGSETARAGRTESRMIGGRSYCVTTETEGAAGSIYAQYAYAFQKDGSVPIFTFSLRFPQCANYEAPSKSECEEERSAFDIDTIVDGMAQSLSIPDAVGSNGIRGNVILGPRCPVVREGERGCDDVPYQTSLMLTPADGTNALRTFSSDEKGRFSIQVPPGEYMIYDAATSVLPECATRVAVIVEDGIYAETTVYCDSGIR